MTNFDGMSQWTPCIGFNERTALHSVVMSPCEGTCRHRIGRKQPQKGLPSRKIEGEVGRELPKDWPKFAAKPEQPECQKVRNRGIDIP